MRKFGSLGFGLFLLTVISAAVSCGGHNAVRNAVYTVPTSISMIPTPSSSMELGTNLAFTATASDGKQNLSEPIFYQSSNTAVLTVAANGLACAGTWDSLANPQVCTPGPVGTAQVTATSLGVSSPPTTVYVHTHIDSVTLQLAPSPPNPPLPLQPCESVATNLPITQNLIYQARAFSRGTDITPSVGQFNWGAQNPTVASFSTTASGLANMVNGQSLNQVLVTPSNPGLTPIYAVIGNSISVPVTFNSCPVQSIVMSVVSSSGSSETFKTTVTDILGNQIVNTPLTWSSSESGSVTVSAAGVASGTSGAAAIIASCTPPSCNTGISPSLPIYPQSVGTLITQNGSNSTNGEVFVTSTGCTGIDGCYTALATITFPANTAQSAGTLSSPPNTLVFNPSGTKAYIGTALGILRGGKGLTVLDPTSTPPSATAVPSAPGQVLAVSPDNNKVVVTDPIDKLLYIVDVSSAAPTVTPYPIVGATAASFSPDSLKAFIVATNGGVSTLYIYSKVDALETIPLAAPANDVIVPATGIAGFTAGASGINFRPICDDPASNIVNPVSGAAGSTMIRALLDGTKLLTLAPPNIQEIAVAVGGTPAAPNLIGCPLQILGGPVGGFETLTTTPASAINLGEGDFSQSLKQLIVSQDGSYAYIVSSSINGILMFSVNALTTTTIPLSGNATPVQAALTPNGIDLYVAASDGNVHVLDTTLNADVLTITFPTNFCLNSAGQNQSYPCKPDLIAVRP
jgi:hypothetical protein